MKTSSSIPLLVFTLIVPAFAGGSSLLQFGEDAQLHFVGDLEFVYEDNVFLQSEGKEQNSHLVFSPGLELLYASDAAASSTIRYQHHFTKYQDYDELDGDYADLSLQTRYDSGVVMLAAYGNYREDYSNSYDITLNLDIVGAVILRDVTELGASMRYEVSELTAFKIGGDYSKINYKDDSLYTDYDTTSIPLTVFYKVKPKVDLTAGVRYRKTDTETALEYKDWYYYVGAVGEVFSPVIYADLTIGWQTRESEDKSVDLGSGSYNLSLIYTGNPKATCYLTLARDYRTSAIDATAYAFTSASLGARYSLTNAVGVSGSIAWGTSEYELVDREDDIIIANLGATYNPNDYLTLGASYSYRNVDGDVANYSDNEVRVSASVRY